MYWPAVFNRLTCSLLLGQFTCIGIFLRNSPVCSSMMLPLPVLTYICNAYVYSAYYEKGRWLPVEIAEEVDRKRKDEQDKADHEGVATTPKENYDGPELEKELGKEKTPSGNSTTKANPASSRSATAPVPGLPSRQRSLPEDNDVIQRSDQDIRKKAKRQDRHSRAWGDLADLTRKSRRETADGAFTFSPASTEEKTQGDGVAFPLPSASPSPAVDDAAPRPPPTDARLSLHPSKHITTQSISSQQELDNAYKRCLHPYTQPELLAPALILPDLDSELKSHANFASMIDAVLQEQYAPSSSPFGYDDDEAKLMEREYKKEEKETRESLRKARARRRGDDDEESGSSNGSVNVPAGVHTALLSSPYHRQVYYSGEAERRGWPSISLNVAAEWEDGDDDDV